MDIRNVNDMKKLGQAKSGETESYEPPKYLVKPHEGDTLYPYAENEYKKAKENLMKSESPLITTSYKKFMDRYNKTFGKTSKSVNESSEYKELDITIEKIEATKDMYDVSYVFQEDDSMYQFSGSLIPYKTGRSEEYRFEPSWFMDEESENFYEENWEDIEEQILNKFFNS